MAIYHALLKAVGRAALNVVGGGIAGDVVCDVLPEVAQKVCEWWAGGRSPDQRRAEVQALAQAPAAEVQAAVAEVVADVAAGQPAEVQKKLSIYLSLMPGAVRASLRRPSGLAEPPPLDDAEGIVPILPARLPRFEPGDRPLPGIDWELEELLGAGGFGEVWKARNPHFDAVPPVALKFCLDPAAKDRLLRHEAAVLNQVMRQGRHPGIVPLLHTYLSADPPCLEYEYVSGGDLSGLLHDWRRSPPGVDVVGRVVLELAGIIAFAHRLSPAIVHRDLKPANILVRPVSGERSVENVVMTPGSLPSSISIPGSPLPLQLKVADFGIGGVAAGRALAVSARGVSQGNFLVSALRGAHTPLYASPQQARGADADPRDDVYSLGVIWYQMLTGSLLSGRPGGTRWTGRLTASGVPAAQVDLLASCLEDEADDRPRDAGDLAEQLARLLGPAPAARVLTPPSPPSTPTPPPAPSPPRPVAKVPAPAAPKPVLLLGRVPAAGDDVAELCPDCGGGMKLRVNKAGGHFLGCGAFPACRGTRRTPPELADLLKGADAGARPAPALDLTPVVANAVGLRFVLVGPGEFRRGSPPGEEGRFPDEGPVQRVRIDRPFYLGVHPVTQRQYEAVMKSNPAFFQKGEGGGPEHPVEQVSWTDADAFCRRLGSLADEKSAGRVYRLPTEAEWEYACRAGTTTPFNLGEALSSADANFDGTRPYGAAEAGPFRRKTTRVGLFRPNAWGLHDLHGNVWEWCADWYTPGTHRSVRGGSWNNSGHLCRSARRQKYAPDFRADNVGFRVLLEA